MRNHNIAYPRPIMSLRMLVSILLAVLTSAMVWGQPQSVSSAAMATSPSAPAFDVKAATDAYLATVPADKRARSDAYFEGGYWLLLWDFVVGVAIALLLLEMRLSARM